MPFNQFQAITFDLWDTVIDDDSDEPKREKLGLRSKRDERNHVVWSHLNQVSPIRFEVVKSAYEEVNDEFNKVWHDDFVTWSVSERISRVLERLDRELPKQDFYATVKELEEMEIQIPPDPIEGAREAIEEISKRWPLAVVSDAIVTPGRGLREWLKIYDLYQHFSGFAFSNEVGRSKPNPDMFESAARQLGVELDTLVHIGDREHNDIRGAHALGLKAILFTGTRDDDLKDTTADAICHSYAELPEILSRLHDEGTELQVG